MKKIICIIISVFMLFSCSGGKTSDETVPEMSDSASLSSDTHESKEKIVYTDYYTGAAPLITEFSDGLPSLPDDGNSKTETGFSWEICDNGIFYPTYEEINERSHSPNGILFTGIDGSTERICPESGCTPDSFCPHMAFFSLTMISYGENGRFLYMIGTPYLGDGTMYDNTCVMRYDTETREYVKCADLPFTKNSVISAAIYSHYLFIASSLGTNCEIYALELENGGDSGYHLTIPQVNTQNRMDFISVVAGKLLFSEITSNTMYLFSSSGELCETLSVNDLLGAIKCSDSDIYYISGSDLYRYNVADGGNTFILDGCISFCFADDFIYYEKREEISGFRYLQAVPNTMPTEYKEVEYPLSCGRSIYRYSFSDNTSAVYRDFPEGSMRYLNGQLFASGDGVLYGCFADSEEPKPYLTIELIYSDGGGNEISLSKTAIKQISFKD